MEPRRLVLLVNRNRHNLALLVRYMEREGYQTVSALNLEAFDKALEEREKIALALIDVTGFNSAIWERCDRLSQSTVPFLVIAPRDLPVLQQAGMTHGAQGVLVKPLVPNELMGLVHNLVEV
ncbi:MAG: response regulator [Candidatus Tectomicrobia bacterium]|nr:response regulator [Candidatus Tectomicrobia bacterium]